MTRHDDQRLADIIAAAAAIADHTRRGGLDDGLVFDAVRVRLIESELHTIGIALRGNLISPEMALECADEIAPGCAVVVAQTSVEAAHGHSV